MITLDCPLFGEQIAIITESQRPLCDIHTPEKHDFERQITAEKLSINNCFWFRFSHSFLKTCLEELYPHFDGYPLKAFHY
ncbi:hypothetical protein A1359_15660 [Methylomonas lenta]|uniref:Uncharacterized protein n=1 Tax=Methylomonas lenta TaxID=980561 RepID=A0A177N0M4_9GAMM|nr:hypothetical protein A1359_15660 [Methylomonas lenta]